MTRTTTERARLRRLQEVQAKPSTGVATSPKSAAPKTPAARPSDPHRLRRTQRLVNGALVTHFDCPCGRFEQEYPGPPGARVSLPVVKDRYAQHLSLQ